jgi:triacylglycerol lipase
MRMLPLLLLPLLPLPAHADCVVLLHGLSRSDTSMRLIEEALEFHNYQVVNYSYPSNDAPIAALVEHVGNAVELCGAQTTHFVTHSLGGILLRAWLAENRPPQLGRVVMLAPPNHGSEVVDNLAAFELLPDLMELIHGPAARELGTDSNAFPMRLPPADYPLGVIAGNRSINPLSPLIIAGENDGTVSVASTRIAGMSDHIVLPATHTMIMLNPVVIAEVLEFLRYGVFDHGITLGNALRKLANP